MKWKTICVSAAAACLIFASAAQAELNLEDARGIWLLDEGSGDSILDNSATTTTASVRAANGSTGATADPP